MSPHEELHEQAEHASHDASLKKVGATMAIVAAVMAIVSVYASTTVTDELLTQQKVSNEWNRYQAKALRRYQSEVAVDLFKGMKDDEAVKAYAANKLRYETEGEEIKKKAEEMEKETEHLGHKAHRLHIAEVFLEFGIVLSSLAILTKRELFWYSSMASGAVGAAVAATAFLMH